ncbi:MAG TPA: HTH domain-containing protein [Devosia sp.]|jgi:hypothetical protein|uniref:HTH domain-containing protein n=1 Tax=Devosia sp. TaxID=1871048 RepID=UPI002DDD5F79|nr:HTH domain-containing protein [Devosia sp.]HEV2515153.1 HTH domain-containing protein [Devosia sp.]
MQANDYGRDRIHNRDLDEFMGLCRALAAKSALTQRDARTIDRWFSAHLHLEDEPLLNDIVECLGEVLTTEFSRDELGDLLELVRAFVGGDDPRKPMPTSMPLDYPPPVLEFVGKRYCLTGVFRYGTRRECDQATRRLGAQTGPIAACTDFLVIGSEVSESWLHSSFGTKIQSAVRWREQGASQVKIVSEDHWRSCIDKGAREQPIARPLVRDKNRTRVIPEIEERSTDTRDPTWIEAIVRVLDGAGTTLHYKSITSAIVRNRMRVRLGQTPEATVSAVLTTASKRPDGLIAKDSARPGFYGLRERSAQ